MQVPPAAVASPRQFDPLAKLCHIRQHGFLILIKDLCAHGDAQDDVIAILAGALLAHAGLAVLGKEVLLVAEVDQRVQPVDGFGPDRSARAAVPAIGTTVFNVFFAPERHATAPACARADIDFAQVKKLHQKGLSGHVWS